MEAFDLSFRTLRSAVLFAFAIALPAISHGCCGPSFCCSMSALSSP